MAPSPSPSRLARWGLRAAVLVGVVLGLLALETQRRTARLAEAHPPRGSLLEVRGLRMHYELAGAGPPVLLLHGCPGFTQDWDLPAPGATSVFADLARDHTTIALDRPGYGWSARYPDGLTTLPVQTDLIPPFLNALGIDRAVIVGHSYGGALALATAVRHPEMVTGVVLLGPAIYPEGFPDDPLMHLMTLPILGQVFRWSCAPLLVAPLAETGLAEAFQPAQPPPGYAKLFTAFLERPSTLHQMATELLYMPSELAQQAPAYPGLTMPVTLLYGDRDQWAITNGAERFDRDVPDARVVRIDNLGHEVQHLRPQLVAAEVRRITQPAGDPPDPPPGADAE